MAKAKKSEEGAGKVRLLTDCQFGKCNDVVELDAEQMSSAVAAGIADADAAAVAYAESLKG